MIGIIVMITSIVIMKITMAVPIITIIMMIIITTTTTINTTTTTTQTPTPRTNMITIIFQYLPSVDQHFYPHLRHKSHTHQYPHHHPLPLQLS